MSMYVKKKDGTIVESQCETVKVTENTLKKLLDATKSARYLFANYTGTLVDDLIQYEDTSNVTNMKNMFDGCSKLESIPLFNTSKVINMTDMFKDCSSLTSVPLMDTSTVTTIRSMFSNCRTLTTIPQFNTANITDMGYTFFSARQLISIPLLNTSKVEDVGSMFYFCELLTVIPAFDFSNVTWAASIFWNCSNLKEIHFTGLKISFDISASTKFTESALVEILNNLGTPTSSQTLIMGATSLAKLTDEEKAIATDKGWTLK